MSHASESLGHMERGGGAGLLLVIAAASLWGTTGVATAIVPASAGLSPDLFGLARTSIGGALLLLCGLLMGPATGRHLDRGAMPGLLAFGACGTVFQIGLFAGFTRLGIAATVFITVFLPPVIVVVWSLARSAGALTAPVAIALVLATAALLCFSGLELGLGSRAASVLGLALVVAASAAFAILSVVVRVLAATYRPMEVVGVGLLATAVGLANTRILSFEGDLAAAIPNIPDGRTWIVLLYLGVFPTALAYVCFAVGMARARSAATGLVPTMVEPAVATVVAFVFLGQGLGGAEIAGCMLLLLAMLVLWRDEPRPTQPTVCPAKPAMAGASRTLGR